MWGHVWKWRPDRKRELATTWADFTSHAICPFSSEQSEKVHELMAGVRVGQRTLNIIMSVWAFIMYLYYKFDAYGWSGFIRICKRRFGDTHSTLLITAAISMLAPHTQTRCALLWGFSFAHMFAKIFFYSTFFSTKCSVYGFRPCPL